MTRKLERLQAGLRVAVEEEQAAKQAFERARQRRREVRRELAAEHAAAAGYPFGCIAAGPKGQRILVDDATVTAGGELLSLTGFAVRRDGSVGSARRTIWLRDRVRKVEEDEIAG